MSKRPASQLSTFGVVTPSPIAKSARVVSSDDEEKRIGNKTISARRTLAFGTIDSNLPATQEPSYMEETTKGLPDTSVTCYGTLKDIYDKSYTFEITKDTIKIGRLPSMDLQVEGDKLCVSRKHCQLALDGDEYSGNTATLLAVKTCWVCSPNDTKWETVPEGTAFTLISGSHFRLVKPGSDPSASKPRQEFQLQIHALPPLRDTPNPGTHSFDCQYRELLTAILEEGEEQKNKKGSNLTLQRPFYLQVDLSDKDDRYLLPITSLRSLGKCKTAILEALWYLRGEDHVRFLQENGCKFWDQQCRENGFVGWNYGLLTNFPGPDGKRGCNQLQEKVVKPLCKMGSQSRNMVCTLLKPDETTVQASCTSGIQFSVHKANNKEYLDLTVNQRSSDTILGLPNDVIVWSIILHLVCREVYIQTKGKRDLAAGTFYFNINPGGAHIYSINMENAREVLSREPIEDCQPRLNVLGYECNTEKLFSGKGKAFDMLQVAEDYSSLARLQNKYPGKLEIQGDLLSVKGYDKEKRHARINITQAG